MIRILAIILGLCCISGIVGCKTMTGPNWLHPGSASEQLRAAKRYDPYPQMDMGPSTTNVRPRGYENPIAEPSRARWYLNGWEP
jgi:hypothetical protein